VARQREVSIYDTKLLAESPQGVGVLVKPATKRAFEVSELHDGHRCLGRTKYASRRRICLPFLLKSRGGNGGIGNDDPLCRNKLATHEERGHYHSAGHK
jgi:hypothetical protein